MKECFSYGKFDCMYDLLLYNIAKMEYWQTMLLSKKHFIEESRPFEAKRQSGLDSKNC